MSADKYWLAVPAAGIGQRMPGDVPKQHRPLAARTVLAAALQPFADWGRLSGAVLALRDDDAHFEATRKLMPMDCRRVAGGEQRMESVRNALAALRDLAANGDWVMVHDAARPCLAGEDLARLVELTDGDPVGGLLARRVGDTLKRDDGDRRVLQTETREGIWQAQTPQIFRFGLLLDAMNGALNAGTVFSDESAVVEAAGHRPLLVEGKYCNLKITWPEDLQVAEGVLAWRGRM